MLSFLRIIKFSLQDIARNIWLSIVTVTILLLALFSINTLLTVRVVSDNAVNAVKEKIDISLYLKPEASESDITALRSRLSGMPEIKAVNYTSKQAALDSFRNKYRDNPEILQALRELGNNPLSPSLAITPVDFDDTANLVNTLRQLDSDIIESRDFSDNTAVVAKIQSVTNRVNEIGLAIIAIFVLTSILVVYNSIRVAVYTHRKEIEIMRLVGASNFFIYMPYFFSAFFYALMSVFIMIIIFYPFLTLFQPYLEVFLAGYNVNLLSYFVYNFWPIFGAQFGVIFIITLIASFFAVRKYARV
ncbi:MAG: permease-like cell division protein FtsX [Patescibacteria group bacterium]|nr:permease-like cell division protein FtsX [Patescibacteria group bacterium]